MSLTREEKLEYIRDNVDRADLYAAIAEEAAELAAAASKMERVLRKNNPTPVTYEKAFGRVREEFCDVLNTCEALYMVDKHQVEGAGLYNYRTSKITRWYNRLKRAREQK